MSKKPTRGRPSKIDLLPDSIRAELHGLLRDKRHTQEDIREAINQLIDDAGLGDDMQLSRTGLNRYASKMESVGARIRQSREVAEVWTAKLGETPTSDLGKLLQEVVRTLAFETSMSMADSGQPVEPKALNQMALLLQRVEQAAMTSHKREKEIRSAYAAEAATAVSEELRGADGMSEELENRIRNILLGKA